MIQLTKINSEEIIINCRNIECVEVIPESKVIMTTGRYYIVKESSEEIIQRALEFNAKIRALGNMELKINQTDI